MNRRKFLRITASVGIVAAGAGCDMSSEEPLISTDEGDVTDDLPNNDDSILDDGEGDEPIDYVTMFDTYAIALYFDGTQGPTTGEISVDLILQDEDVDLPFWHGHGGLLHGFTLSREHIAQLKQGLRVEIQTSEVDSHSHTLFIDPVDVRYRVPGATPVQVPV